MNQRSTLKSCCSKPIISLLLAVSTASTTLSLLLTTVVITSVLLTTVPLADAQRRACTPDDFVFDYTACGDTGERWRVALPRQGTLDCQGGVPAPQRGLNCTFTCGPGNFVDIETQSCRACPPGTYSLGGGVRFDEFTRLPAGFTIENFDAADDRVLDTATAQPAILCEKESGWQVRNAELLFTPSACVSKLSFSAHLVKPGYVEYTYRMPSNARGIAMNVVVRNEQCQSYRDEVRSLLTGLVVGGGGSGGRGSSSARGARHEESTGEWQKKRIELRTGPNVVSWTVTNSRERSAPPVTQPLLIGRIDILGVAFTRSCTACPAGTYSSAGAGECLPCDAGFFSTKGSDACGRCPLSQYSGPKSSRCFDRPPCRQADFYAVNEPCRNGRTHRTFKKVLPAFCSEDLAGAAKLPSPEPDRPCPPCNPGMAAAADGVCRFCAHGEFSDGNACHRCPASTLPSYGLNYVWWNSMPPGIETRCEFVADDSLATCDIGEAWLPSGDALISAPSLQRGIAFEAIINVPEGFFNPLLPPDVRPSAAQPLGALTVVFDTKCVDDSCVLYLIEDVAPETPSAFYRFLGAFNGTQPRRVLTHAITRSGAARFMIAFVRSGATTGDDSVSDQARIYAINVTNVGKQGGKQGGGAAVCTPCASDGVGKGGCAPCDNGHYMDEQSRICIKCPEGTYSNVTSSRVGPASCVPCGPHLFSDGSECSAHTQFSIVRDDNSTALYDISAFFNTTLTASGVRVFAREGASYFHFFNVSIGGRVSCADTFDVQSGTFNPASAESVDGRACRLTAIPTTMSNRTQTLAYVSPLLLASSLVAITEEPSFGSWQLSDQSLGYADSDASSRPLDLHFFFATPAIRTESCPNGTGFALTARCEPAEKKKPQLHLPTACPDGTCDGCLYHVLLSHASACPLCSPSDYKTIRGECINGRQTIHSIPRQHCVITGAEGDERTVPCSALSANAQLLIITGVVTLLALLMVLCMVWRRNQRLEYKYMKLIESKGGYELAAAESCALDENEEEDDEEDDRVVFSKGKRGGGGGGGGFFSKLRGKTQPRGDSSSAFAALENDDED